MIDVPEQKRHDIPDAEQIPPQTEVRVPAARTGADATTGRGPAPVSPGTAPPDERHAGTTPDQPYHRVRRTRFSGLWIALTLSAVVLLVLLVFIIENGQRVDIAFFGVHGQLSLGVALLLAAICGVLLVAVPGYGRILQLRKAARRNSATPATRHARQR
ncbi:MAG TPA: LapA family protein [Pseudonocardiaceae bacterium]|nr:LapA family protein [Pseudonocardiaceae bacterium]